MRKIKNIIDNIFMLFWKRKEKSRIQKELLESYLEEYIKIKNKTSTLSSTNRAKVKNLVYKMVLNNKFSIEQLKKIKGSI